jgi:hypothetical protein
MTDRSSPTWIPCAGAPADTVDRLYAGSLDGVVIKGLLSEEECTKCMTAVAAYDDWQMVYPDPLAPKSIGVMLSPTPVHPSGPPPQHYFPDVARDSEWVREQLSPLIPRLEERLAMLSGGRPVVPLDRPRPHRLATVREMSAGYGAPTHVDAYVLSEGLASLFENTDRATQLSWYVVLQLPGSGGELEVASRCGEPDRVIPLEVGDGVLFDGGRLQHRVTSVASEPARITVGGFAGLARSRDSLYYWG